MRALKYLRGAAIFAVVFAAGLWVFAPWDRLGTLAFEELRAAAALRGYYVTGGVSREGLFPPKYLFSDLDVEGPMAKVTFREASVTLRPLRSAVSRKAAFLLEFGGASVKYIPQNSFEMSRGEAYAETDGKEAELRDIAVEGDFRMTGGMALNLANMAVTRSDAVMTVPPMLNMVMNAPMMRQYVESTSAGEWRIKPNANQNK